MAGISKIHFNTVEFYFRHFVRSLPARPLNQTFAIMYAALFPVPSFLNISPVSEVACTSHVTYGSSYRSDASVIPHQDATYSRVITAICTASKLQSAAFPAAPITAQYFRIATQVLRRQTWQRLLSCVTPRIQDKGRGRNSQR
jgi:hypothetical protein